MPPEGFVAGSRSKFALDLTSGEPPPPPRFFGIIGLEENLILILGLQRDAGKILKRNEFQVSGFEFQGFRVFKVSKTLAL
jgi:hypothetical protein